MKPDFRYKLGSKIIGILMLYFVVAVFAIGMTLHVSTQFEGGAAAINDAGSERMRSYRMVYLLAQLGSKGDERNRLINDIQKEIRDFERVLAELEHGDPGRPLFLPNEPAVVKQMIEIRQNWSTRIKPLILLVAEKADAAPPLPEKYPIRPLIEDFVEQINGLVTQIELSNARYTALLRSLQIGLVVLALVGTVVLILWFHLVVLRPLGGLNEGIRRMAAADFSVHLPIERRDEFGELADGFNRMSTQLHALYGTLEERVEEKTRATEERTRSLAEKNKELTTLYEISAFLNESAAIEELCGGFLRRVLANTGLTAGAVRLIDATTQEVRMLIHQGVSDDFAVKEAALCSGECLCGNAAQRGVPLSWDLAQKRPMPLRMDCQAEGFRSVAVFTIHHQKQVVGIFNLYSPETRTYSERETRLLETLGQHLGLAIETLRLVAREKEMAVSEERNCLAQELHDSIAQSLAFLNIQAQMLGGALDRDHKADAAASLGLMREGIQESYAHVRELLRQFRTRMPQTDLSQALHSTLLKFQEQTGVRTEFKKSEFPQNIEPEIELQTLHIIQEALSNVRKHSQAKNVRVDTRHLADAWSITVTDDGIGFDLDSRTAGEDHIGLRIMRERAQRIGAQLNIRSIPCQGVEITLELPSKAKHPRRRIDDDPHIVGG